MPITFRLDDDFAIENDDVSRLLDELTSMGRTADLELADRIRAATTVGSASPIGLELSGSASASLARALDHLRNLGRPDWEDAEPTFSEQLARLRDRLVSPGLTYRLDSWARPVAEFWSYTGQYELGDRVVTGDGRAWRITEIEQPAAHEPGRMLVETLNR